ncbi:MAG: hypothetical protein HKN80_02390 [Acidimicrobiia bacterium]|nr:hypothetical protein [Acidimicrobiia bacterium]
MDETVRVPGVRWIVVVLIAVAIVIAAYQLLLPHPSHQYPDDHGRAQLSTLGLSDAMEDHYSCLIAWAEQNGRELYITSHFELEPTAFNGEYRGHFRIRTSGLTDASGAYHHNNLWATVGFRNSEIPFGLPCGRP